jgi:Flp pilus assembly pilin Flp
MLIKIIKNQAGAIFAEYGLLITLIAVACVIAVSALGERVFDLLNSVVF